MKPPRKDNPSSMFYWKDYENDESLRISSLAAQGLWMRLLCVAAKADPYGYILVNGFPLEATGAARLAGVTEGEAQSLLQELERNGVFSRDRKGRMFSRRLVRDAAKSAKAKKNGAKGGNPALGVTSGKTEKKGNSVNHQDKTPLKPPYPLTQFPTEEEGGGGSARVRETDTPTLRERIMDALGVDRSGLLGPSGKLLGTQAEMQDVARWSSELGLTEDEQIAVIRETMQGSRAGKGPPGSLRYFNAAMSRFAEAKARPLPAPATSSLTLVRGGRNDPRFDEAHREFARRVGAGEINRGPDPSDPFAGR
jgi:hypothetical protein